MTEELANRINAEIERRLKTMQSEADYFICLMAQNDAQSQARIAALEAEVRDLRAALEKIATLQYADDPGVHIRSREIARTALNR